MVCTELLIDENLSTILEKLNDSSLNSRNIEFKLHHNCLKTKVESSLYLQEKIIYNDEGLKACKKLLRIGMKT